MRRIIGIAWIAVLATTSFAAETAVELQQRAAGGDGVSLACPAGWEVRPPVASVAITCVSPSSAAGDFLENVIVIVDRRSRATDAKPYLDQALAGLAGEIEVVERGSIETDAWSASTAIYRKNNPERPRVVLTAAIVGGEVAYLVMSTAADDDAMKEYREYFEATVRSFRVETGG